MDKIKNIVLAATVVGVLLLGIAFFSGSTVPTAKQVADEVSKNLGALVGPDIPYPYFCFGGVCRYASSVSMKTATTTICSIQNPASATSTVLSFSAQITTGFTGVNTFDLGTSTISSGTSSPAMVLAHSVGSSAKDTMSWTSSATTTDVFRRLGGNETDGSSFFRLGPKEWLNYKIATGTVGNGGYTGTCKAVFEVN